MCIRDSSLATAAASSMGTLTVAAHQVLVGLVTLAQFCPEPLSACAQSELASVAARRGFRKTTSRAERRFAKDSARLLLCCGGALGLGVASSCYLTLVSFPHVFSADVHVAMAVRAMAPIVFVAVFAYALVCVMDGLIFAAGRMVFAAGASIANLPLAAAFISAVLPRLVCKSSAVPGCRSISTSRSSARAQPPAPGAERRVDARARRSPHSTPL